MGRVIARRRCAPPKQSQKSIRTVCGNEKGESYNILGHLYRYFNAFYKQNRRTIHIHMIETVKQFIKDRPYLSLLLVSIFSSIIGNIGKAAGLDLYKLIKKIGYYVGIWIKTVWRTFVYFWRFLLKQKKTITSAEKGSQDRWREEQK